MNPLHNLDKYDIILASSSPRRQELLKGLDIDFTVKVLPNVDENYPDNIPLTDISLYISQKKAEAHRILITPSNLIITADTIVIVDNKVLGKPESHEEAIDMLMKLSGKVHHVITGVTIITNDKTVSFKTSTQVEFSPLSQDEINYYVDKYHPFDKAGAYGIQEWIGYVGINSINGSFYNVMGLPVQRLYTELKKF